jgi:hypothetical protein
MELRMHLSPRVLLHIIWFPLQYLRRGVVVAAADFLLRQVLFDPIDEVAKKE